MSTAKDVAVALSFDYDALSVWIGSFAQTSPTALSRGEFCAVGLRRILAVLENYKVPGSFYVPGHTAYAYPKTVEAIAAAGHEIGHHGWTHESPLAVTPERERWILEKGLEALQTVAGVRPAGYRSPAWDNSPHSVPLLLEHGFEYDSSMMGSDFEPYWCRVGDVASLDDPFQFGKPVDLVEMPVSWHLDDFLQFEFVATGVGMLQGAQTPRQTLETWKAEFDYLYDRIGHGIFTPTMHPQVIGRGHRLTVLEGLIEHVLSKPGARFTTVGDYCRQWRKGKTPSLPADAVQPGYLEEKIKRRA
ncbi:polysaccharide deacetylase family protein [Hypericibacter sp.]|uniref:polysaccharide deacetylase family protein n=2 Tax=Hypericibacter sp. TaxID=2705401 RepID=UPI003D6CEDFA